MRRVDVVDVVAGRLVVLLDWLLLLVVCVGAMITPPPEPPAAPPPSPPSLPTPMRPPPPWPPCTAGRTATAGVDVTDLGVLAAAGVGGDVATRRGVDVVAAVIDVVVDAARVDVGALPRVHVAGVVSVVVVADDVAVALDVGVVDVAVVPVLTTTPSEALMSRLKSRSPGRSCRHPAERPRRPAGCRCRCGWRGGLVVAGEVRLGGEHPLRREGQAVVVGDRVLQRLDRVAAAVDSAAGATTADAACVS